MKKKQQMPFRSRNTYFNVFLTWEFKENIISGDA